MKPLEWLSIVLGWLAAMIMLIVYGTVLKKIVLAAALMTAIASPVMAGPCNNLKTTNIKNYEYAQTHPGFRYESLSPEQGEAQYELDTLKCRVKELESAVRDLQLNATR